MELNQLNQGIKVSTSEGWLMSSFYCNDLNPLSLNYTGASAAHAHRIHSLHPFSYSTPSITCVYCNRHPSSLMVNVDSNTS